MTGQQNITLTVNPDNLSNPVTDKLSMVIFIQNEK